MALTENDGNIDLSIDWLRAKGITKAAKKSDRIASEGLIGSLIKNGSAAMIELNSETDFVARNEEFQDLLRDILEVSIDNDFGKGLCMHIAATNPLALTSNEISPELIEREKQIALEQARESGKPENIIEKMVEGRIKKFMEENALLSQVFVIDGETKIEKLLETKSSELNEDIVITRFTRMQLGDGIEKKEDDFAGEVAAAISKN